jgi:hypothetical protein
MRDVVAGAKSTKLDRYDPAKGLKSIAVADPAALRVHHFARAKDAEGLRKAIAAKLTEQAKYVVWRDGTIPHKGRHGGDGQSKQVAALKLALPPADPGAVVAHRWRKRLCRKTAEGTVIDEDKMGLAEQDAAHRAQRICEQENANTIRGTGLCWDSTGDTGTPFKGVSTVVPPFVPGTL